MKGIQPLASGSAATKARAIWQPLLSGALAEQASAAVAAVAADLTTRSLGVDSYSLAGGGAGVALLYAYLARDGVLSAAARANQLLDAAAAAVTARPMGAALFGGFTGVAWAIAHIRPEQSGLSSEDDELAEIDAALLTHVRRSPWRRDYDLISGLVGFGVYALERLPRPAAACCLEQIVERLAECAEQRPQGVTWRTRPELLIAPTRADYPSGYFNLGVAHGVPGVIALLGAVCAAGIAQEVARTLLNGAVAWLLSQRLPPGAPSQFGYWVEPNGASTPSRLAWCYGDLGLAVALLYAARCVGARAWEAEALIIARHAAARSSQHTGVKDAGLCHGTAGVGHLFNRIYQASGEERYAETARHWFAHTLALRQRGQGVGGFQALEPGAERRMEWTDSSGFLCGAAGVALALQAAISDVEPDWDRSLIVAVPPRWTGHEYGPPLK